VNFHYLWSKCYLLISHIIFIIFECHINLKIVHCTSCNWNIVSNNFFCRNLLVRVNQEGIYNRLSNRKTRYWATILYYTLHNTALLDFVVTTYRHVDTKRGSDLSKSAFQGHFCCRAGGAGFVLQLPRASLLNKAPHYYRFWLAGGTIHHLTRAWDFMMVWHFFCRHKT
jgi:hypothetical protein